MRNSICVLDRPHEWTDNTLVLQAEEEAALKKAAEMEAVAKKKADEEAAAAAAAAAAAKEVAAKEVAAKQAAKDVAIKQAAAEVAAAQEAAALEAAAAEEAASAQKKADEEAAAEENAEQQLQAAAPAGEVPADGDSSFAAQEQQVKPGEGEEPVQPSANISPFSSSAIEEGEIPAEDEQEAPKEVEPPTGRLHGGWAGRLTLRFNWALPAILLVQCLSNHKPAPVCFYVQGLSTTRVAASGTGPTSCSSTATSAQVSRRMLFCLGPSCDKCLARG